MELSPECFRRWRCVTIIWDIVYRFEFFILFFTRNTGVSETVSVMWRKQRKGPSLDREHSRLCMRC